MQPFLTLYRKEEMKTMRLLRKVLLAVMLIFLLSACGTNDRATIASAPDTPANVAVSAGDGQIVLIWDSSSRATSYNIYYSTTSGATKTNGTKITGATSPFTYVGLSNGTTYYYVVTAVNSYGESIESSEVSATPYTLPAVSIAKWLGNARSALSFIWDDNNEQHYNIIGPIFEKYGYHASFGIITAPLSKFPDYVTGYKSLLGKGHELCNHSNTHARLIGITEAAMRDELSISKDKIIEIFGVIPKTFIHPGNGRDANMDFFGDYYLYSRINNIYQDPENFIANMSTEDDLIRLNYIYSLNVEKENWVTLAGHGVDGGSYEPILSKDLDDFLYSIKDQSVWVDTYSNVALYNEIRLAISSVRIFDQQIVIDDSKINYGRYAAFGITSIPITVIINSAGLMNFTGSNILDVKRIDQQYLVTVNLTDSNTINWGQ